MSENETEEPATTRAEIEEGGQIEEEEQIELMQVVMNGETFLLPVEDIAEIIRPVALTPVPMAPDHLLGLANIRGQIVCMVDPGKVMHLAGQRSEQNEHTRFLVLRHSRMHLGIWVDVASSLYRVAKTTIADLQDHMRNETQCDINIEGRRFSLLNTGILFE